MDRQAKNEALEVLRLFRVKAKDREDCLEGLICVFNCFRRRSHLRSEKRRKIEAEIRKEESLFVKCVGSEDDYIILHSNGNWAESLVAASPAQARAFVKTHGDKELKSVEAWKQFLSDFSPA